MCEYCGCQCIEAIAALTREHDEIRAVAHEAAAAAQVGALTTAAAAAGELLRLLVPHVEIEERGLFPSMAREFADHVTSLESEHRELEVLLTPFVDSGTVNGDWPNMLIKAVDSLCHHIFREQDGLFPASLSVLTPADWDRLDEVRASVMGRESHANYHEHLSSGDEPA